jgi:hypothetical protein
VSTIDQAPMRKRIVQAAQQTWDAIAWDCLKAQEYETGRKVDPNREPRGTLDGIAVGECVADSLEVYGQLSEEDLAYWRSLPRDEAKALLREAFPEECYGY